MPQTNRLRILSKYWCPTCTSLIDLRCSHMVHLFRAKRRTSCTCLSYGTGAGSSRAFWSSGAPTERDVPLRVYGRKFCGLGLPKEVCVLKFTPLQRGILVAS